MSTWNKSIVTSTWAKKWICPSARDCTSKGYQIANSVTSPIPSKRRVHWTTPAFLAPLCWKQWHTEVSRGHRRRWRNRLTMTKKLTKRRMWGLPLREHINSHTFRQMNEVKDIIMVSRRKQNPLGGTRCSPCQQSVEVTCHRVVFAGKKIITRSAFKMVRVPAGNGG